MVRYCPLCQRNVEPKKKFNWVVFIVLLILGGFGACCYLGYYMMKPSVCPICGSRNLQSPEGTRAREEAPRQTTERVVIEREVVTLVVCPHCGAKTVQGATHCSHCGAKL